MNLIDAPDSEKDAADKAILVDMILIALDNPPPSSVFNCSLVMVCGRFCETGMSWQWRRIFKRRKRLQSK